jgi:hypothetical protein
MVRLLGPSIKQELLLKQEKFCSIQGTCIKPGIIAAFYPFTIPIFGSSLASNRLAHRSRGRMDDVRRPSRFTRNQAANHA